MIFVWISPGFVGSDVLAHFGLTVSPQKRGHGMHQGTATRQVDGDLFLADAGGKET